MERSAGPGTTNLRRRMGASPATDEIRRANTRYHDLAAEHYDAKWGIDYGPRGQLQVTGKLRKAIGGGELATYPRGLEVGAGTGYFGLNLVRAGVVGELSATDISSGMLEVLEASAERLGVPVRTARCAAVSCRSPTPPSISSSGTPCCTTYRTSSSRSASSCASCAPAG